MNTRKNKLGGLFWFLVIMAIGCITSGNIGGALVFAALAFWRYLIVQKKQDQVFPIEEQPINPSLPDLPQNQKRTTATQPSGRKTLTTDNNVKSKDKPKYAGPKLEDIPIYNIELSQEKRNRKQGFPEYTHSGITRTGHFDHFVVVDTETTGLAPHRDRIVELSAIKYRDCEPVERFQTLINPKKEIPEEATAVNHITNEMVAGAPTIAQVLPAFEKFINGQIIVGHNLQFDLKMLYYSGSNIMEAKHKYIDTLQQSRRILKAPKRNYHGNSWDDDWDSDYDVENFKLGTLLDYYGIENEEAHRSASDALATGQLFVELCNQIQNKYEV
ncbi:3'-5' exonuclease [uncultured Dubosiella sp.]|uniref:3'-5' exonuclease n=1 Tax=uncultured Dubosiella sp. TaxID=1937011 RepID=UPI00259BA6BD|nr:3'-5' exonuclease [uncultured Dubosiella sp.]